MLFICLIPLTLAMNVPTQEALIRNITFEIDNTLVPTPFFPPFAAWDFGLYSFLRPFQGTELIEFTVNSIFDYPVISARFNNQAWKGIISGVKQNLADFGSFRPESNLFEVKTNYPEREYIWQIQMLQRCDDCILNGISLFVNEVNLTCTPDLSASIVDYNCTNLLNINATSLSLIPLVSSNSLITVQRVSIVNISSTVYGLESGASYTIGNFFQHKLESILRVKVTSRIDRSLFQYYFFRLNQDVGKNSPLSIAATYRTVPEKFLTYWDVMPRFHPDVYNYTIVPWLPVLADINLILKFETKASTICTVYPRKGNFYSWVWESSNFSKVFDLGLKWNYFTIDFKDWGSTSPRSPLYNFTHYRRSANFNLGSLRFFVNPIVKADENDYSTNSSALPFGYNYSYDARSLDTHSKVSAVDPPLKQYNTKEKFSANNTLWTLTDVEYSEDPFGLMMLVSGADSGSTIKYRLNEAGNQTLYTNSTKTVYPLEVGINNLTWYVQSEDYTYEYQYNVWFRYLSGDTSLVYLNFSGALNKDSTFDSSVSTYSLVIPHDLKNLQVESQTLHQNASIEAISNYNITNFGTPNLTDLSISLPLEEISNMSIIIMVTAESPNIHRNISITISRQDLCGNGRRWNPLEQCDTGAVDSSGCVDCTINEGWVCFGGGIDSADTCEPKPTDPQTNSTTNNTNTGTNSTDNSTSTDPICGNSKLENGEECDDGNLKDLDGCDKMCLLENNQTTNIRVCGNGILENGEECDDGNLHDLDGCDKMCVLEKNQTIENSVCGNGILEIGEQCDDGNLEDLDGCDKLCKYGKNNTLENSVCGNGILENGEECDDGNLSDADNCNSSCKVEIEYSVPSCENRSYYDNTTKTCVDIPFINQKETFNSESLFYFGNYTGIITAGLFTTSITSSCISRIFGFGKVIGNPIATVATLINTFQIMHFSVSLGDAGILTRFLSSLEWSMFRIFDPKPNGRRMTITDDDLPLFDPDNKGIWINAGQTSIYFVVLLCLCGIICLLNKLFKRPFTLALKNIFIYSSCIFYSMNVYSIMAGHSFIQIRNFELHKAPEDILFFIVCIFLTLTLPIFFGFLTRHAKQDSKEPISYDILYSGLRLKQQVVPIEESINEYQISSSDQQSNAENDSSLSMKIESESLNDGVDRNVVHANRSFVKVKKSGMPVYFSTPWKKRVAISEISVSSFSAEIHENTISMRDDVFVSKVVFPYFSFMLIESSFALMFIILSDEIMTSIIPCVLLSVFFAVLVLFKYPFENRSHNVLHFCHHFLFASFFVVYGLCLMNEDSRLEHLGIFVCFLIIFGFAIIIFQEFIFLIIEIFKRFKQNKRNRALHITRMPSIDNTVAPETTARILSTFRENKEDEIISKPERLFTEPLNWHEKEDSQFFKFREAESFT